jgi:hypothetical protein
VEFNRLLAGVPACAARRGSPESARSGCRAASGAPLRCIAAVLVPAALGVVRCRGGSGRGRTHRRPIAVGLAGCRVGTCGPPDVAAGSRSVSLLVPGWHLRRVQPDPHESRDRDTYRARGTVDRRVARTPAEAWPSGVCTLVADLGGVDLTSTGCRPHLKEFASCRRT